VGSSLTGSHSSRAATAREQLLTDGFTGIINCNRAELYWQVGRLKWRWAHLKRHIQALMDHPDRNVNRMEHDLRHHVTAMFQYWREYHADTILRCTFHHPMPRCTTEVTACSCAGALG
jgi:hypothetical protein